MHQAASGERKNFDYSDTDLKNADIIDGWTLYICSPDVADESIYFNPLTYTGIKGVRSLSISEQMSQEAEEKEIDWYTYWPDLQEIIIRES